MYLTRLFCSDLCYSLLRKLCYHSENRAMPL